MPPQLHLTRPELKRQRHWSAFSVFSRRSFATSAFEADDELSSSDGTMSSQSSESDLGRAPQYVGHDARPTSFKELLGWYMYGFAAEVYVVCGIGSFIPILLETLARENGVLLSDPTKPCGTSDSKSDGDGQCVIYVLGIEINTASFAMYTFSVSVLLQALLVVSISCAADHGHYRKKLLLYFAWIGALAVMSYVFISKETYLLGALLTILSNTSFGASFVLLNSFLPLLVRNHPDVLHAKRARRGTISEFSHSGLQSRAMEDSDATWEEDGVDPASPLLPEDDTLLGLRRRTPTREEITSTELQLSSRLSANGMGIGYMAALFVQCVAIGILVAMKNTTWSQRVVLLVIGSWWAVFTIPSAFFLRPRPGPPLVNSGRQGSFGWLPYLTYAWKSLFRTIQQARRLTDIMLFLAAWFLLSDAIATTSSTAILFAKTQLHMRPWALGMINVITTMAGILGAFGWPGVSRALGLKAHHTILVCIALFELIPIYGLMGYLPFVKSWGVVGLQQPWEMFPLAAIYGLVMGGLSSYCRSLYGELIPPGSEAAFYALYAITDKGSSVFGPTIVGAIIDRTGSIRPAFWFLGLLVGLPAPLMWLIDVERGKKDGQKLVARLAGSEVCAPLVGGFLEENDED
ncbi:Autophagy protein 22 [Claviceps sp. LM220 group G6]|nr:Autophagy protein 22 [Claviceps sp. LM218 group G6]KAG6093753.1 Autophagy protein 22 [Claviceps sp. LM220 group G6]KAG6104718.1 Autophagy protein 22 [Claviceps sp. LM219 group G6]KAG6116312.1 Autophagy protein 22 [Claviceps sp. LM454 group G7]